MNSVPSENSPVWTIGFMSGTSVDAVDAAIVLTDGVRVFEFGPVAERKYTEQERDAIFAATKVAQVWNWQGKLSDVAIRPALDALTKAHADAYNDAVGQCKAEQMPVLAGVHGQTLLHKPPRNGVNGQTLQVLDAEALRAALGIPMVYDFRSADVDAGGQGAPLAPVYHEALVRDLDHPVAVLNLGGVANVTFISNDEIVGFDCGPANGPIDEWVVGHHRGTYDADGSAALAGKVHDEYLVQWLDHPFFGEAPPKSLDRYDFNANLARGLSYEDGCATLTAFSAAGVAIGLSLLPEPVTQLIVCGGGRRNPAMLTELKMRCPVPVRTAEDLGWRGDSIEAEAFALLAVRSVRGLPLSFPGTTGVPVAQTGGILIK